MKPSRELCILVAFHAILNDTEEYDCFEVDAVVPASTKPGHFKHGKRMLSCEESTAEHAVRYGEALWQRMNKK